jgi:hypothetical protein
VVLYLSDCPGLGTQHKTPSFCWLCVFHVAKALDSMLGGTQLGTSVVFSLQERQVLPAYLGCPNRTVLPPLSGCAPAPIQRHVLEARL